MAQFVHLYPYSTTCYYIQPKYQDHLVFFKFIVNKGDVVTLFRLQNGCAIFAS